MDQSENNAITNANEPIITHELLRSWDPCTLGYFRYCELFPDGATLPQAIDGLIADDHDDWGFWLFEKCRSLKLYEVFTAKGYRNAGDSNAGDRNAGHWNAGDSNAGDSNAGNRNAGNRNAGNRNAGNRNAGHWNAGNRNAGHWNAGHWNAGNRNAGYFNSDSPSEIRVFNKPCSRSEFDQANIPSFLYFDTTRWIADSQMTDQEKIDNPMFYVAGGYLKTIPYKQAFQEAYAKASDADKALLLKLPNFDADVLFEISGIRVEVPT